MFVYTRYVGLNRMTCLGHVFATHDLNIAELRLMNTCINCSCEAYRNEVAVYRRTMQSFFFFKDEHRTRSQYVVVVKNIWSMGKELPGIPCLEEYNPIKLFRNFYNGTYTNNIPYEICISKSLWTENYSIIQLWEKMLMKTRYPWMFLMAYKINWNNRGHLIS